MIEEEKKESTEQQCTQCGIELTDDEIEDEFKLSKGIVCHNCILKFMKRKRLIGEIVSAVLVFVSIISFYVGNYIFGIFFALLMLFIFLDTRAVNNYITDIETRDSDEETIGFNGEDTED